MYDLFLADWYTSVERNLNYKIFKHRLEFETYLTSLPTKLRHSVTRFRSRNHRLPIETGRWLNIDYNERICNLCHKKIGDEFHYLLVCDKLAIQRENFIKPFFTKRPNILKYDALMNIKSKNRLISLSKFIRIIFELVGCN